MRDELSTVPEAIATTWETARHFELADKYADIFGVVVLGAGAAAAAAVMLQAVVAHTAQIPVIVVRGESLPAFVGPDNLVIACDAADGTPETLGIFEEAADRGAKLVIVAPGEAWVARATAHRAPLLTVPAMLPPALMVGPLLVALLGVLHAAQVIYGVRDIDVVDATALLQSLRDARANPSDDPVVPNLAEQVARQVAGRLIAVQGLGILAPVVAWGRTRFATQAKQFILAPESDPTDAASPEQAAVIALRSAFDPPRALAVARDAVERRAAHGVTGVVVPVGGTTRIAQALWAVHFLDWVTLYLTPGPSPSSGEGRAPLQGLDE